MQSFTCAATNASLSVLSLFHIAIRSDRKSGGGSSSPDAFFRFSAASSASFFSFCRERKVNSAKGFKVLYMVYIYLSTCVVTVI